MDELPFAATRPISVAQVGLKARNAKTLADYYSSIVGHVHLRVGDPSTAEDWWHSTLGFDTAAKYGAQAVFLSTGGYHHHIGANAWQSAGAGQRDKGRSGLSWVELRSSDAAGPAKYEDPWGTDIRVVPGKPA